MDGMTDKQYDDAKATLLRLVLEILRHSKDLSEAIEKVEALLPQKVEASTRTPAGATSAAASVRYRHHSRSGRECQGGA